MEGPAPPATEAKLDRVIQDGAQPGIYEDRMTIMIDDGKVPLFAQQGCWLTCHTGQRDMPKQFTNDEVKANALRTAIKKGDMRKYLPGTRNDPSDWKSGKSVEEIAKIKAAGGFVDLIQWRAHRSHAVGIADDGYVLEFRNSDAGKAMFGGNADARTHAPKFMWDEKKVGYKSINAICLGDRACGGGRFRTELRNPAHLSPGAARINRPRKPKQLKLAPPRVDPDTSSLQTRRTPPCPRVPTRGCLVPWLAASAKRSALFSASTHAAQPCCFQI